MERRSVPDSATIETVKAIAKLRNSVAHRNAVGGIALRDGERGMYKDRHVFTDREGLKQLTADADDAAVVLMDRADEIRFRE